MLLHLLVLLTVVRRMDACGGSSGCCRRAPPPPVAQCGGGAGCQPGYQCGQYGCARRRALAGITTRIDGVLIDDDSAEEAYTEELDNRLITDIRHQTNISIERLMNPNFIFHSCCESRGLPDACLKHCHFNTYTAQGLEKMFRKRDKCPVEAANEIHYCAAQGIDHRKCCSASGVSSTLAGEKCLSFCDQRPNRFTTLDVSYLPCYEVFESMKRCFFTEIRRRAERKFSKRTEGNINNQNSEFRYA